MARPGIGKERIKEAIEELTGKSLHELEDNEWPGWSRVREITGTGNAGTINNHLKALKAETDLLAQADSLPEELQKQIEGFADQLKKGILGYWQSMNTVLDERITVFNTELMTSKDQLESSKREIATLQQDKSVLEEAQETYKNHIQGLNLKTEELTSEIKVLDTKAKGQEQLIAELKERNQESLTLIQRFENERNILMDKSEKLSKDWSEKENNLNSLMQELRDDLQSKNHQVVSLTESLRDADQKLKGEQHTFRKERERLEKKVTELSEQLERVRQDYTNESSKHLEVLADLKHEQNTSKGYLQQITDLKSDNAHLRSQAETLTSAITEFASKKATATEGS